MIVLSDMIHSVSRHFRIFKTLLTTVFVYISINDANINTHRTDILYSRMNMEISRRCERS